VSVFVLTVSDQELLLIPPYQITRYSKNLRESKYIKFDQHYRKI
jgi:hypothetical protein